MTTIIATILIVDDQQSFRLLLQYQLQDAGYSVIQASSAEEAIALLRQQQIDLILCDLIMPGVGGLGLLTYVQEHFSTIPFVVVTSQGTINSAVESIRMGAFDYIEKDAITEKLLITIARTLKYKNINSENIRLINELQHTYSFQNVIAASSAMRHVLEMATSVSKYPVTSILLDGESGCGKEVLARAIHVSGGGASTNFVGINCAAIPEALLESELFGHVRGAFTGADRERAGKFALAKGGTILLDEIGDMPLVLQAKLLRVLEERKYEKVGSSQSNVLDCRVIAATNQNLATRVAAGLFREDLFHRIHVFPISIPPLRERVEDIHPLVELFLKKMRKQLGKVLPGLSQEALRKLYQYRWPGNIRELRNCIERAAIIVPEGELLGPDHLILNTVTTTQCDNPIVLEGSTVGDELYSYHLNFTKETISLDAITTQILDTTLQRCNGNKSKAASVLKVGRNMFYLRKEH